MPKRDAIEEFMKNYGRIYDRLEPRDREFIDNTLEKEMERLRGHPMAPEPSKQQDYRDSRLKAAAEIEAGMWEGNETERTAYRFWKPEQTAMAGDHPLEFPTDYRLDALVPWERGTSTLDEGAQVYEMTGHEWLKDGDIVTTPEGFGYVVTPSFKAHERSQNAPDFAWSGSYSETIEVPARARDQSKESPEPAQALSERDKAKHFERDSDVVEKKESLEKSWLEEMKSRAEQSMYTGHGKTDELSVSSCGQFSASFSQQVRPGSTQADLDNAIEKMGLGPARDRQQQAETQKESDKFRDLGKEAER